MKLRLTPLAVAVGLLFATLSPALALVRSGRTERIDVREASARVAPSRGAAHSATTSSPATRSVQHATHATHAARKVRKHAHRRHHSRNQNRQGPAVDLGNRDGFTRPTIGPRVGPLSDPRGKPRHDPPAPPPTIDPAVAQHVLDDAQWIQQAQLGDGAIANYVDQQAVWPYLSNFAAMGLARATIVTGHPEFAQSSWRWLHWYQAHENASGFVTDYKISGGVPVSTGDMDSTDAYAGTFLMAVRDTYTATNDLSQLSSLHAGIAGAVAAIEATQDSDGLTWAKPSWHVKYAMDQAETYGGLVAGAQVAQILGDGALAARATSDATKMRNGFAKLWNPSTQSYDWAVHGDGAHQATDWSVLYPDALQQAWVVAFGLAEQSHVNTLVSHFTSAHPQWDEPSQTDRYDSGTASVGYWVPAGWALGVVSPSATGPAAQSVRQDAVSSGRAWPFTPSDAGQLIVLETWSAGPVTAVSQLSGPQPMFV